MPESLSTVFGEVLAKRRRRAGLSQEALAEACGLHRTYVSQLERGLKSPTLRTLFDLAEALGASPARIVAECERLIS